jgi:hypothetical protein
VRDFMAKAGKVWVVLSFLWLIVCMIGALDYLSGYKPRVELVDVLRFSMIVAIPPLILLWLKLAWTIALPFLRANRRVLAIGAGVLALCVIVLVAALSYLGTRRPVATVATKNMTPTAEDPLATKADLDAWFAAHKGTNGGEIHLPAANVDWDAMKTLTANDMTRQPDQPTGGCNEQAKCAVGYSCMQCDDAGCYTAGHVHPGQCWRVKGKP